MLNSFVVKMARWPVGLVAVGCAALALGSASVHAAGLIGDTVSVTLYSPGGLPVNSATDTAIVTPTVVDPGVEIAAGDGSSIGAEMLANVEHEFIDIGAFTFTIRLITGATVNGDRVTGYATGAQYIFDDLDIAGFDIVDASITANSGFSNFSNSWLGFVNATDIVTLNIADMIFSGASTAEAFGDITITLQTRCIPGTPDCGGGTVPEPASAALVGLGLLALAGRRRAAARRGR